VAAGETAVGIEIRPLTESADLAEAVRLQKTIWGFDDIDLLPRRLFVVAGKIGGQILGAFDNELGDFKMVGFCLSIPGLKPAGRYYLHSHMLGVLPAYQNRGVGRGLKLAQRQAALEQGFDLIEWTFDPLEIKNSHFNIERLGAVVRRFVPNQYGMSSSPLHSGLPTDRCVAEWPIASLRVKRLLEQGRREPFGVKARIRVPVEIDTWRQNNQVRARECQAGIAADFDRFLSQGLVVLGYEVSGDGGAFLFGDAEPAASTHPRA